MNRLIKKTFLFLFIFIIVSFVSFILLNEKPNFGINYYQPNLSKRFLSKINEFENFISINDTINLFLGSSQIETGIDPTLFGGQWFSFSNDEQNIYNSYIFLYHYINSIIIDSIIISLHPFDFPTSYLQPRQNNLPFSNHNFIFFSKDSISNLFHKQYNKRTLEKLKQHIFYDINDFIENKVNNISKDKNNRMPKSDNISLQHHPHISVNMDSMFIANPYNNYWVNKYYYNLNKRVNLFYFKLFNDLCRQADIKVIYILMPKSKYYHANLIQLNRYIIWEDVKDSLRHYIKNLHDYEKWKLEDQSGLFYDTVHLSDTGAIIFSNYFNNELRK